MGHRFENERNSYVSLLTIFSDLRKTVIMKRERGKQLSLLKIMQKKNNRTYQAIALSLALLLTQLQPQGMILAKTSPSFKEGQGKIYTKQVIAEESYSAGLEPVQTVSPSVVSFTPTSSALAVTTMPTQEPEMAETPTPTVEATQLPTEQTGEVTPVPTEQMEQSHHYATDISFLYIGKQDQISLAIGQKRHIYCKPVKEGIETPVYQWESSDPVIATVDENGWICGKKTGQVTIVVRTLEGSQLEKKLKVTVTKRKNGTHYSENNLNIVSVSHSKYTYAEMEHDMQQLANQYGDCLQYSVGGKTWDDRNLYKLTLGNSEAKKKVMVQASIHAREYMTAQLVMRQVEFYCNNYYTGTYQGKYFSELFSDVCFVIVPMSNPDGVSISQFGASGIRNQNLRKKVQRICAKYGRGRSSYYTTWKANARGVDLNRNFNQYWSCLRTSVHSPNGNGYKGSKPVSERESKFLVKLNQALNPKAVISYHAMGEILFWNFGQTGSLRNREIALRNTVKGVTGYRLVGGRFDKRQSTGFGDWVGIHQKTPTVTIEIGNRSCPLPAWQFSRVWAKNKLVFATTAKLYFDK